nr:hypothetical protein [Methanothrix sp.]
MDSNMLRPPQDQFEVIDDGRRLIQAMGLPVIKAPSEGEAQAAYMAARGDVDYAGSQD